MKRFEISVYIFRQCFHQTTLNDFELTLIPSRRLKSAFATIFRCYKCGIYGNHKAAKCRVEVEGEKMCYGCHATDHLVANCPVKQTRNAKKAEESEALSKMESLTIVDDDVKTVQDEVEDK